MATVFERHQAGTGNGLRNVLGNEGKEVMVACDDERRWRIFRLAVLSRAPRQERC